MNSLVASGPSSLPNSCAPHIPQQQSYFNLNMILYVTMVAIIVNSIYSMLIYNEVRRLSRHVHEAERNMVEGGRLLYNVTSNMRECLLMLLNMLHPQKLGIEYENDRV